MHSLIALVTIAFLESYVKSYSYGFSKSSITRVDDVKGDSIGRKHPRCRFLELSSTFENFIILGGSGDLATTKIIPGLFHLCKQYSTLNENRNVLTSNNQETLTLQTRIPYLSRHFTYKDFTVKLAARSDWSDDFLRKKLEIVLLNENKDRTPKGEAFHGKLVEEFLGKCFYTRVDSYDVEEMSQLMSIIKEDEKEKVKNNINSNKNDNNNIDTNNKKKLDEIDSNSNNNDNNNNNGDSSENDESDSTRNIVYFALPPKQYLPALHSIRSILTLSEKIPKDLKNSRISKNIVDVILEKPIGYDSKTALEITELALLAVNNLGENLWCVDHYLAKDLASAIIPLKTSQNPLISRLFHDYLNSNYISKLDVIFSDTSILDGRSGYFDDCGIVRDILQNHLIQLLALLCCDTELDPRFLLEYFNSSNSANNDDKNENKNENDHNDENNNDINNNNNDSNNIKNNWKLLSPENKSKIISEKRSEILSTIPALLPSELTVGQYDSYKTEKGVKMGSKTSTFASSKIQVIYLFIYLFLHFIPFLFFSRDPLLLFFFPLNGLLKI
jgi:glucose-6-phosphate 1-dehydrogenase